MGQLAVARPGWSTFCSSGWPFKACCACMRTRLPARLDGPRYRVYFHDASGASKEREVAGADLAEVLEWAERQRGQRTFVLYVCVSTDNRLGLVRLAGADPNAAKASSTPLV
jgi:hypothetical protein